MPLLPDKYQLVKMPTDDYSIRTEQNVIDSYGKVHMPALIWIIALLMFPYLSFADQYKCSQVVDGDTIQVDKNGNQLIIRLVGIDAPELPKKKNLPGQPFCVKAKEYLANRILNKVVDIKFYGMNGHGRLLGEVFVDGININLEMIYAGLAEVYRGKSARNLDIAIYRDAESKAKGSIQGIWVLRDQYFSPWDWREIYR